MVTIEKGRVPIVKNFPKLSFLKATIEKGRVPVVFSCLQSQINPRCPNVKNFWLKNKDKSCVKSRLLMAKRKKEEEEATDPSSELPKKIKTFLRKPSGTSNQNPASEKLVDEILSSPALVNKVDFPAYL